MLKCGRKECSEYGHCLLFFDCPLFKPEAEKQKKEKENKYHAEKCVVDGIVFDSRKEANRYSELLLLSRTGQITGLKRQVSYELIPAQRDKDGKLLEKSVKYVADFVYVDKDGKTVVEDTKGYKSGAGYAVFVLKRKMLLYKYGIQIKEI